MSKNWTIQEYRDYVAGKGKPGKNKYGAIKTEYNGRKYDSKVEAEEAKILDLRKKAGEIKRIQPQYRFELQDENGKHVCYYYIDFMIVLADNSIEVIEVKGFETALWLKKWDLLKAQIKETLPGATMVLIKRIKGKLSEVERYKK